MITVTTKDGLPMDPSLYSVSFATREFQVLFRANCNDLVIDSGLTNDHFTFVAGCDCKIYANDNCTFSVGHNCVIEAGDNSNFMAGLNCKFIHKDQQYDLPVGTSIYRCKKIYSAHFEETNYKPIICYKDIHNVLILEIDGHSHSFDWWNSFPEEIANYHFPIKFLLNFNMWMGSISKKYKPKGVERFI